MKDDRPAVAVLGAGIMGSGIAQLAAMAGHRVVARDPAQLQLERAQTSVQTSLARFLGSGTLDEEQRDAVEARLTFTEDLEEALAGAEIVVEAVPERLQLKHTVLREAHQIASPDALFASNTSQLSITAIAAALSRDASRVVGVHFFNPPVMMRLVELIAGLETAAETLDRARRFAEGLGREVVVCRKDSPGFLTSRAYSALRLECVRMLEEGLADAEDIDKAMRLAFNFPMGPFELGDMNGLDTYVHVLDGLTDVHGERFRPTVGLRNMIAAGRLGRKSGRGFYEYRDGAKSGGVDGKGPAKGRRDD